MCVCVGKEGEGRDPEEGLKGEKGRGREWERNYIRWKES